MKIKSLVIALFAAGCLTGCVPAALVAGGAAAGGAVAGDNRSLRGMSDDQDAAHSATLRDRSSLVIQTGAACSALDAGSGLPHKSSIKQNLAEKGQNT